MALLNDEQRGFVKGLVLGVGIFVVGRHLIGPLREVARPVTKAGVRSALGAKERLEELVAQMGESFDDIVAEVRAERDQTRRAGAVATSPTGNGPS
jgi:hypothetical protein